ncbi:Ref family recombination enhancement nuclease [Solilutibacter silvestris]|uniref:Ref family recombination enhancement nuclease n=1 Tax=Solilutibacter silvestris TaxID=1645665 RepID=UPI003D32E248
MTFRRAIGNPTKAQQAYQDQARTLGCIACKVRKNRKQPGPTEIHHRTIGDLHGQKQLGHDKVIALCSWHHRGELIGTMSSDAMRDRFGPSLARHKRDFMEWVQDVTGERSTSGLQAIQDGLIALSQNNTLTTHDIGRGLNA